MDDTNTIQNPGSSKAWKSSFITCSITPSITLTVLIWVSESNGKISSTCYAGREYF